jgi:hypothetical protein
LGGSITPLLFLNFYNGVVEMKTYSDVEIEAINFLSSMNICPPKDCLIEEFENIYHYLFNIYPSLHYQYLYYKYGSRCASNTVWNENMSKVVNVYKSKHLSVKDNFDNDFNPFLTNQSNY